MNIEFEKQKDSRDSCSASHSDNDLTSASISVVIPTADRVSVLEVIVRDLLSQRVLPKEILIVDASVDDSVKTMCEHYRGLYTGRLVYQEAKRRGAAAQRNQGVEASTGTYILFVDDDIEIGSDCVEKLWVFLRDDERKIWGGVNAMITNQRYAPPGWLSRRMFHFMNGHELSNYAGKCIGPVMTVLPQDDPSLPEYVEVGWLNTTCTMYRREALPNPVFDPHFAGYSLMEDVDLSLRVRRHWKLANARTARILHNSQPGPHKANVQELNRMEVVNRHYVMTETLGQRSWGDYTKLLVLEMFNLLTPLAASYDAWRQLPSAVLGKLQGCIEICRQR